MAAEAQVDDRYAGYEHWLVLNAADQIVEVRQLLAQQRRTEDYLASGRAAADLSAFEPDLSGIRSNM